MSILDRWQKKDDEVKPEVQNKPIRFGIKPEKKETEIEKGKVGSLSNRIIVKPMITEKTAILESQSKYSFIVNRKATKTQVKKAIKEIYGIMPVAVNMANIEGKRVRFGRGVGKKSDYKKAFVSLPKGKTITIHEGV